MRALKPDFKTIADFRADNRKAFRAVFREFIVLCRKLDLFGRELLVVDGTRIKESIRISGVSLCGGLSGASGAVVCEAWHRYSNNGHNAPPEILMLSMNEPLGAMSQNSGSRDQARFLPRSAGITREPTRSARRVRAIGRVSKYEASPPLIW